MRCQCDLYRLINAQLCEKAISPNTLSSFPSNNPKFLFTVLPMDRASIPRAVWEFSDFTYRLWSWLIPSLILFLIFFADLSLLHSTKKVNPFIWTRRSASCPKSTAKPALTNFAAVASSKLKSRPERFSESSTYSSWPFSESLRRSFSSGLASPLSPSYIRTNSATSWAAFTQASNECSSWKASRVPACWCFASAPNIFWYRPTRVFEYSIPSESNQAQASLSLL